MIHFKYTLLALLAFAYPVQADIGGKVIEQSEVQRKFSLTGHTGQDPVYCVIDEDPNIGKCSYVDSIYNGGSSIEELLINGFVRNWNPTFITIGGTNVDFLQTPNGIYFEDQDWLSPTEIGGQNTSNPVPAPPIFLLGLAGLAVRYRRKP